MACCGAVLYLGMRRLLPAFLVLLLLPLLVLLAGCDIPTPPPELPTATAGSSNPENSSYDINKTPVRIDIAQKGYTPVATAPGNIFFVRDTGLWRISPDGSGLAQLSSLTVTSPPQPSPDGQLVAFTTADAIYAIPAAGGVERKLAAGAMIANQRLGWLPNGKALGYIAADKSVMGREIAWAIPSAGGQPSQITSMTDTAVSRGSTFQQAVQWSPDANKVAVGGPDAPFQLIAWTASGPSNAPLIIGGGEPDWSPDSRSMTYAETTDGALLIYGIVDQETTPFRNELRFLGTGLGDYAQGPGARFSPVSSGADSDLIAYRSHTQDGEPQVGIRLRGPGELNSLPPLTNNPAWSPGGDKLVVETGYLKAAPFGMQWTPSGLSIARLNFAPNQQHLMFPLVKDGKWPAWGK